MVDEAPRHMARSASGRWTGVLDRLIMLQCKFRFLQARWLVDRLLRQTAAAKVLQAMIRDWLAKRVAAKIKLQAFARMFLGKLALRQKRREVDAAKTLQRAYRMMHAKRELDDRRSISGPNAILVSSEYDIEFNADKTLDGNHKTFWCSRSGATKKQWIVYDLGAPICIGTIELLVREDTTTPRACVVEACNAAKGHYNTVFAFGLPAPKNLAAMAEVLAKQPMNFHNRKIQAERRKRALLVKTRRRSACAWTGRSVARDGADGGLQGAALLAPAHRRTGLERGRHPRGDPLAPRQGYTPKVVARAERLHRPGPPAQRHDAGDHAELRGRRLAPAQVPVVPERRAHRRRDGGGSR